MAATCGTGAGNFPQPGDPNTNTVISASGVFGGILVTWEYPSLNGHAVAHFNLYRSTSSSNATATRLQTVTGDIYFDQSMSGTQGIVYYYWIQVVSVNGTVGEMVGPASATMEPAIEQILSMLTGQIADSFLDQNLRSTLGQLDALGAALVAETSARENANQLLGGILADGQARMDSIDTLVQQEVVERSEADSAIVAQVNVLMSQYENNYAVIISEQEAQADAISSTASTLDVVQAAVNLKNQTYYQAEEPQDSLATGDLWFDTGDGNKQHRWDGSTWEVTTDTSILGSVAAIADDRIASATADGGVIAQKINTLGASFANTYATAQSLTTVSNTVDSISASHMIKLDVNGYVAGYGLHNDGVGSSFAVRADTFSVGSSSASDVIPFIIQGGKVYLDTVLIKNAAISSAMVNSLDVLKVSGITSTFLLTNIGVGKITNAYIANVIQSNNYVAGSSGWKLNKAGTIECRSGYFRGDIHSTNAYVRGDVEATSIKAGSANIINSLMLENQSVTFAQVTNNTSATVHSSVSWGSVVSRSITIEAAVSNTIVDITAFVNGDFYAETSDRGNVSCFARLRRGNTVLSEWKLYAGKTIYYDDFNYRAEAAICASLPWSDSPGAGTHTYYLDFSASGYLTFSQRYIKLFAAKK